MNDRRVSEAVIRRLPKYYRHLTELEQRGVERISSAELSREMSLNASQIRQDFNCFGGFGQQGYGYQVSHLLREIGRIIGLDQHYNMVIVGAGNIGKALMRYNGFDKDNFHVAAAFDRTPAIIGREISGVTVRDVTALDDYLHENDIQIGIICTQKEEAQSVCDRLVAGGLRAIWNFAPIDVVADVFVENIHLSDTLSVLSYRLRNQRDGE